MGSTAKGLITGFICRLCSKMNRYVILIYGEEGERMGLADKINSYLPITVTRNDPLPKTVCPNCVDRLEKHSRMVQMITRAEKKFQNHKELLIDKSNNKAIDNTQDTNDDDDDDYDDDGGGGGDGNDDDNSESEECLYSGESELQNQSL